MQTGKRFVEKDNGFGFEQNDLGVLPRHSGRNI